MYHVMRYVLLIFVNFFFINSQSDLIPDLHNFQFIQTSLVIIVYRLNAEYSRYIIFYMYVFSLLIWHGSIILFDCNNLLVLLTCAFKKKVISEILRVHNITHGT